MNAQGITARRGLVGGIGVLAVIALFGAIAFACVPQASIKASPTSGPVGTKVTLTGSSFDSAGQPVKLWWGGAGKQLLGTATVSPARTFSFSFEVPASSGGAHIVSATQSDANGQPLPGSPVNTTFKVDGPAPAAAPANVQGNPESDAAVNEPAPAVASEPAPAVAADPAPASAAPAPTPPRVRVAPARPAPRAPVVAPLAPAPAAETAAPSAAQPPPAAAPAPAVAPAPEDAAPATTPARRSVMVSMSGDSSGSSALAIVLVGLGLLLALGASALVLAGRRESKAPAGARR